MTFYIESLGCAKNQVDSEIMLAALEQAGYTWVPDPEQAELILINTCGFIASAKEESIQIGLELKSRFPGKKVIMAGCLVKRYSRELKEALTELDGFISDLAPEEVVSRLADIPSLQPLLPSKRQQSLQPLLPQQNLQFLPSRQPQPSRQPGRDPQQPQPSRRPPASLDPREYAAAFLPRQRFLSFPGSAFVKTAEGCNNRCSYCAIPLIRGDLSSRSQDEVVAEVETLLSSGIFEINLIAQDLASFGRDRGSFELQDLLSRILALKGDFWLRLLYLHPDRFSEGLLSIMSEDSRLLPYFDLPFQHAAPTVLKAMGRRGDPETYLTLIERIRKRLPGAVIRSSFLVGFPGETEKDFQVLRAFQDEAVLDWLGVFTYSREEGTAAATFKAQVRQRTAQQRKNKLEEVQIKITEKRLDLHLGKNLVVLVEEKVKGEDLALARAYLQAPDVDGLIVVKGKGLDPGGRYRVRVGRRNGVDLEASLDG